MRREGKSPRPPPYLPRQSHEGRDTGAGSVQASTAASTLQSCMGRRGSGKSWFFAALMIAAALRRPGLRCVCAREFQKSLAESSMRLLSDTIQRLGVGHLFTVQHDKILTPGGGAITFVGLADQTSQSIKSLEGVSIHSLLRGGTKPFSQKPCTSPSHDPCPEQLSFGSASIRCARFVTRSTSS